MNLQTLRNEITNDTLSRGYSEMTDGQIAIDLNTAYEMELIPLESTELLAWSGNNDRYKNIKSAADDINHPAYSIAAVAYLMITRDNTQLDLNLSDRVSMLDALVLAGVLTADDKIDLYSKATKAITRAAKIGLSKVRPGEVTMAKGLG